MTLIESNGRPGRLNPQATPMTALAGHGARLTLEPLERGVGLTLGTALRRILLSSLQGCAPTQVSLVQATHEQAPIAGLGDDVLHLMHALKGVVFRMPGRREASVSLLADRAGPVRAGDILTPVGVAVLNPAHVIAQLAPGARLDMRIKLEAGRGHTAGLPGRHPGERTLGGSTIHLDASFSPVRKVTHAVEPIRVEHRSGLDRLVLDIETNGAIAPDEALRQGMRLLMDQLDPFAAHPRPSPREPAREDLLPWMRDPAWAGLMLPIDTLDLTLRSANGLRAENIALVGELIQRTELALLRAPQLGRKSLLDIKDALAARGWKLGTVLQGWPPAGGDRSR